jgi:hypothetical protein
MTSTRADFEPLVTVVVVGATQELNLVQESDVDKASSSLHVFAVALTMSPLLDSHHTDRVIVPTNAEQSEFAQVDQVPAFQ